MQLEGKRFDSHSCGEERNREQRRDSQGHGGDGPDGDGSSRGPGMRDCEMVLSPQGSVSHLLRTYVVGHMGDMGGAREGPAHTSTAFFRVLRAQELGSHGGSPDARRA